ncbi:fibronectin type III domain-containing protein [Pilimelia columellifera]|uniref:fibronectin type III domain-containing protein n=1 Tax=Pilimelia columellifera TaxID=706574 RepID=UPI0031DA413F
MLTTKKGRGFRLRTGRALLAGAMTVMGTAVVVTATATPAFACHGLLYGNPVRQAAGFTFEVTSSFATASSITAVPNNGNASISGTSWATGQPALTVTVTGLTPGQSSTVQFNASLAGGGTACSSYTNAALLAAAVAPTLAAATATADGFTVNVTDYDATRYDYIFSATNGGAATVDVNGLVTVTGLNPGQSAVLTVDVTAKDGSGFSGTASATRSGSAINPAPAPPSGPAAPTAVAGDSAVKITWAAPSANGSVISGYRVIAAPGGASCDTDENTTMCIIGGLTNGRAYTFTVVASSNEGNSSASAASNTVTPAAVHNKDLAINKPSVPPGSTVTLTATGYQAGSSVDFYIYSTPVYLGAATANSSGVAVLRAALPAGWSGNHTVRALGIGLNGLPLSQDIAVLIAAATPGGLPVTGNGHIAAMVGAALAMLTLGCGLVFVATRRRRSEARGLSN